MEENRTVAFAADQIGSEWHGEGHKPDGPEGRHDHQGLWWKVCLGVLAFILVCAIVSVIYIRNGAVLDPVASDYIAVLDFSGEITSGGGDVLSGTPAYDHSWTMDKLDDLKDDPANKGLIIRVDSPGGEVYTTDEIYFKLKDYQKTGKPVYSYMGSQAASGGYYISAPCDKIYANRNCWTGSIGVTIGTMYDISGLLDKMGIKTNTITSGKNKAMGSRTEELTDEQRAIIQELIDEAYDQFVGIVASGRHMSKAEVRELADGRIYSAKQAKKLGLIDGICNEDVAIRKMMKDEDLENCELQYLAPEEPSQLYTLIKSGLERSQAGSELSSYRELMDKVSNGNKLSIEYKAAF